MKLFEKRCPNCWGKHLDCNQTRSMRVKSWFAEQWRIFTLTWADRFASWAIRLRGQKVYGTDCQVTGNEAAALTDRIWVNLVIAGIDKDQEYCKVVDADLQRLGQLARATWFHEHPEVFRPAFEISDHSPSIQTENRSPTKTPIQNAARMAT